jgi:hypothetical protein
MNYLFHIGQLKVVAGYKNGNKQNSLSLRRPVFIDCLSRCLQKSCQSNFVYVCYVTAIFLF